MDCLLAELHPLSAVYPWNYAMGELLPIMASRNHPRAKELAIQYRDHSDEQVREGASNALIRLNKMSNPGSIVIQKIDSEGFDALTEPQRAIYSLRRLIDEVNNGGLALYRGNSSGDYAMEAASSLDRVAAVETAQQG